MGFFSDLFGISDKRDARRSAQNIALRDFNLTTPGGASFGFSPESGFINVGDLNPIRQAFLSAVGPNLSGGSLPAYLTQAAGTADRGLATGVPTPGGIDPSFLSALQRAAAQQFGSGSGAPVAPTSDPRIAAALSGVGVNALRSGANFPPEVLAALARAAGGQAGSGALPGSLFDAVNGVRTSQQIDPAMIAQLGDAARSRLATAGQTADTVAADRLAALRAAAAPHEQEFIRKNVNELFSKGRLGTNDTLSGKVGEGVTRALSEADLSRIVQSQELGRATQADAVSQALGLSGQSASLLGQRFQQALGQLGAEGDVFNLGQAGQNAEVNRLIGLSGALEGATGSNAERALALLTGSDALTGSDFARRLQGFDASQSGANQEVQRVLSLLSGAEGVYGSQFNRALTASDSTANRALQRFNVARSLFETGDTAQNTALQRALTSAGAVQGIDSAALQSFMAALQGAVARSNAAAGQTTAFTQLANTTPLLDAAVGIGSAFAGG